MNSCRSFELLEGEVASAEQLVLAIRSLLAIVVEHLDSAKLPLIPPLRLN